MAKLGSGLNQDVWLLIGKKSLVLKREQKARMFPRALHMPPSKRTISRIRVDFGGMK